MKRTTSAAPLRNPIMYSVAALVGVVVLVSVQSNAQSRYSHPSDLNMNNEFQGGIRQYLACSQTHFDWGDREHQLWADYTDDLMDGLSDGVEDINTNPPTPNTRKQAGKRLSRFIAGLNIVVTAFDVSNAVEKLIDKYIVRPASKRQYYEWYESKKIDIDGKVKERLKECARLQVEFNLGGGTAVWGGNRSWDIYYTSIGTGGAVVFSLPRLRRGIVTIHQVSNGN